MLGGQIMIVTITVNCSVMRFLAVVRRNGLGLAGLQQGLSGLSRKIEMCDGLKR